MHREQGAWPGDPSIVPHPARLDKPKEVMDALSTVTEKNIFFLNEIKRKQRGDALALMGNQTRLLESQRPLTSFANPQLPPPLAAWALPRDSEGSTCRAMVTLSRQLITIGPILQTVPFYR